MPTSPSATNEPTDLVWPALPTETEIYILPDGRVVIADLPAELALALDNLGLVTPDMPANLDEAAPDAK